MSTVLVVHGHSKKAEGLSRALLDRGAEVSHFSDGGRALEFAATAPVSAVVAEMDLPTVSGLELLESISLRHPDSLFVLVSPDQSAATARAALRAGAFDYLVDPWTETDLEDVLSRLIQEVEARERRSGPHSLLENRYNHIIGSSPAITGVFKLLDKVAATDSTVMIYGESGTGKELIARAIHENSRRRDKPLIPVNCGAIPEELLESELFGHEKGAFTSAIRSRMGRFEMADGGTIFLDEVADMSAKLQVKLLRVLQEHQFERIGGTKTISVNIRVITATNKNLRQAMEEGRFREDLFYRLNVIPVTVPPLRERQGDISLLVHHFLNKFSNLQEPPIEGLEPEALQKLAGYDWPGNIRELENIVERMVILAENERLTLNDLPPRISNVAPAPSSPAVQVTEEGIDFNKEVSDFENNLIRQALEMSGGVKNKAALLLGLNRTTLVEKMKKKGF